MLLSAYYRGQLYTTLIINCPRCCKLRLFLTTDIPLVTSHRRVPILSDDIFQMVALYLSFRNKLRLSLMCKHAYAILPPRLTHVACRSIEDVQSLTRYILADIRNRAPRLRSILIYVDRCRPFRREVIYDLLQFLLIAKNLSHVVCPARLACHLPAALSSLTRLEKIGYEMRPLPDFWIVHDRLQHLYLQQISSPFRDFLALLSQMTTLRTLTLDQVELDVDEELTDSDSELFPVYPDIVLHSLLALTLCHTAFPKIVSLPILFPNIREFYFEARVNQNCARIDDVWVLHHLSAWMNHPKEHCDSCAVCTPRAFAG